MKRTDNLEIVLEASGEAVQRLGKVVRDPLDEAARNLAALAFDRAATYLRGEPVSVILEGDRVRRQSMPRLMDACRKLIDSGQGSLKIPAEWAEFQALRTLLKELSDGQ